MKQEILSNLDDAAQLEKLYRADRTTFKRAFNALASELPASPLARFWQARLNFPKEEISWGAGKDLVFVIIASLVAGLIAKLPVILSIDEELFYTRNLSFIPLPALCAWFAWKNKLAAGKIAVIAAAFLAGVLFINFLPRAANSDTLLLSCIHLPLFLWAVLGFAYAGDAPNSMDKRLGYLRYNGDLIVMTTLIVIAGGIMSGVTIGLFNLIGFQIERFYGDYIIVIGLSAAPIVGTYLVQTNPQLVGKVSPVIARIFSPLVLVMLLIYLVAIMYSGKDPYNDRDFLLTFNALLVGVMAIIFFSIAGTTKQATNRTGVWILLLLSMVTIVVNGIALSAILFRISTWGITPNRAAVLGSNVLVLLHLVWVTVQLYKVLARKKDLPDVGKSIAAYLPVYIVWVMIVAFIFPFLFGFR